MEDIKTKTRATDLGVFIWNEDGTVARWQWQAFGSDLVITDRRVNGDWAVELSAISETRRNFKKFKLMIHETAFGTFKVTTCGTQSVKGTRHREFLTIERATAYALKWLDYRFAATIAESL